MFIEKMKQETIQMENVQKVEEVEVVHETEQRKKVHYGFDLNKTFYYEDGGEFHPGDGFVQEMEKEKKVHPKFDLNGYRIFADGELDPNKEIQKGIIDMLKIYMPHYYGEFHPNKK